MEQNDIFEITPPVVEEQPASKWYVDLNKEEFVAFHMLTARYFGPLRQRIPTLVVSALSFLMLAGYAAFEWATKNFVGSPDPVLLVGALLVLIPSLLVCGYVPYRLRRTAAKQYDRSVDAGMDYCGQLIVYPDCIEKVGHATTGHVRLDERTLFIETAEMMVISVIGSPAIVLPARCMTDEMAAAVRDAMNRVPARNRRFVARLQCRGEAVPAPTPKAKPEELWVTTFTYTPDEYATVLRGIIQQHFWRMSPMLALVAMMGAILFGNADITKMAENIPLFVVIMLVLVLVNMVLPLRRVKAQAENLSAHDLTMQVRLDTMMIHNKLPKGGENWVLWCDVDHVYEREDFVEIVHNKKASLFIPKRCIPDLNELDAIIKRCRGEQ